jgi:DNA uptake protein ComE-like DNA-binding protein
MAFSFDPNKTPVGDFQRLGFSRRIAERIVRYREKGGKFKIKNDLLKIYGMDSALYRKLYGFVDLPEKEVKEAKKERPRAAAGTTATRPVAKFDINRADSSDLRKIYGIGERLAVRIVRYREVLGGFVGLEQVREVFGLDSAVAGRLMKASYVADDFIPGRLNINKAGERTLAIHPYLRKSAARAIVTYRFQHGEFTAITDLGKIHALDDETIQKIAPYLTVEDPAGGERVDEQRNQR